MHEVRIDVYRPRHGVIVVSLRGSLGPGACEHFETAVDQFIAEPLDLIVLDIADLTYMGSRALGDMVRLRASLRERNAKLRLAAPRPEISNLFEAARLDAAFPVFGSVQDALDYAGATL